MARKRLKDMTLYERVERQMKGITNEEAEEVAIKILSQIAAKHLYIRDDFDAWHEDLSKRLFDKVEQYSKEHSLELATARYFYKKDKSKE